MRRIKLGLLLAGALLLAAGPSERLHLRARIPVGSAWRTSGTMTVKTTVAENGQSASKEEISRFTWEERVLSSDSLRGVLKETRVLESEPAFLKGQVSTFQISPRGEQRLKSVGGNLITQEDPLFEQPPIFPLSTVSVGDSWDIEQPIKSLIRGDRAAFPAQGTTRGKGTLTRMEGVVAVVDLALTTELLAEQNDMEGPLSLKSSSQMSWTLGLDPATGWVAWQKMHSTADQSALRGQQVIGPTVRVETSIAMTSQMQP